MDIIDVLTKDHKNIKAKLTELVNTDGSSEKNREKLFAEARALIIAHADAEEATLYLETRNEAESRDQTMEGKAEHDIIEDLVVKISNMPVTDEMWLPNVKVLQEMLEHHMDEEEEDLFPDAKKLLSAEKQEMMAKRFKESEEAKIEALV